MVAGPAASQQAFLAQEVEGKGGRLGVCLPDHACSSGKTQLLSLKRDHSAFEQQKEREVGKGKCLLLSARGRRGKGGVRE